MVLITFSSLEGNCLIGLNLSFQAYHDSCNSVVMLLGNNYKFELMSELITEYFTCNLCKKNHAISYSEIGDIPTTCNSCWLKMEMWQRYEVVRT